MVTEHHDEALTLCRDVGDRHGEANSLHNLGLVAEKHGKLDIAIEYVEESVTILCKNTIIVNAFRALNDICGQRGSESKAIEWCEEAIDFAEQIGHVTKQQEFQEQRLELRRLLAEECERF
ncbi:tetratricopeptide repeat protein (plasmid) [Halocatena salina]|uniref:Tetratricopeptide repeat protein n=1 Tax=Halocatena salina TaxID=2934340 RepID=A0A8U0A8Z0_9EURY|nr:tetratricopeptide repeat protein [Halocatena salina]UPM45296.1 tetratricopeptide repeat protein [Halocatena salina]